MSGWVCRVGIDEAGYGPNLGPLVTAVVAVQAPADHERDDWWDAFPQLFSRTDARRPFVIDDSKRLLARRQGAPMLERTLATLLSAPDATLDDLFQQWASMDLPDLHKEHWRDPATPTSAFSTSAAVVPSACSPLPSAGLSIVHWQARVLFPERFNQALKRLDNKSAVEQEAIEALLRGLLDKEGSAPVAITVDRLGGRKNYRTLVESIAGDDFPLTVSESSTCSEYAFTRHGRPVRVRFLVQADAIELPVALASMTAKHLRERCMAGLNQFWTTAVTDLAPTAGYPVDARRFLAAIDAERQRRDIPLDHLWRRR